MSYREGGTLLDISCGGRGMQQTMLLHAYMYANPGAVLLLDEPDAHLETLRQRQTYQLIELAEYVPEDRIDPEVVEKLNSIADVAEEALHSVANSA